MPKTIDTLRFSVKRLLRRLERVTHTDNVYLAKGLAHLGSSQVVSFASGLVLYLLFARLVTPEVFGSYKYLVAIFELSALFSLTGIKMALVRSASRGFTSSLSDAFRLRLRAGYILGLPLLGFAVWAIAGGNRLLAFGYLSTYILGPVVYAGSSYVPYLQGTHAFSALSRWLILQESVMFVLLAAATIVSGRAGILFLAYLATMLFWVVGYAIVRRRNKQGTSDPDLASHAIHQSWLDVFQTVAGRIDSAILYHVLGPVQVAQYAFAVLTADQLKGALSTIYTVAGPKLASRSYKEILPSFFRKMLLLGLFGAATAWAYGWAAPTIYHWLFPAYESVVEISRWYAWSLVFLLPATLGGYLLNLQDARREATIYNIATYAPLIVLLVVGGFWYGMTGIIFARVIGAAIQLAVVIVLLLNIRRRVG